MPRKRRTVRGDVKPFDAATKYLLEADPVAWLAYVGVQRTARVAVVDSDVSTIIAEADKVLRIEEPTPWLVHIELQSGADASLGERLYSYSALLRRRHRLPVLIVAVLLRPEADAPALTGLLRLHLPDGSPYLDFRYRVVRAWQQPVEAVLSGALATLPLAPLADDAQTRLPDVIRRMDERVRRETAASDAAQLWATTYLLMGLRYPDDVTRELLRGVRAMRESSTYRAILAEGHVEEARRILTRLGSRRFGPPDARARAALERIADLDRLERLADRVLDVGSWDDLIATP